MFLLYLLNKTLCCWRQRFKNRHRFCYGWQLKLSFAVYLFLYYIFSILRFGTFFVGSFPLQFSFIQVHLFPLLLWLLVCNIVLVVCSECVILHIVLYRIVVVFCIITTWMLWTISSVCFIFKKNIQLRFFIRRDLFVSYKTRFKIIII